MDFFDIFVVCAALINRDWREDKYDLHGTIDYDLFEIDIMVDRSKIIDFLEVVTSDYVTSYLQWWWQIEIGVSGEISKKHSFLNERSMLVVALNFPF